MNKYTIEEICKHRDKNDAWIIINNDVYDISEFINIHPGGKQILLNVLGEDVSEYFYSLHRESILDEIANDYKIGSIIQSKI